MAQSREVINVVDRQDMSLIEVGRRIVEGFIRPAEIYIAGVIVSVIKRLRIGVGHPKLQTARVATINLDLQTIIVRRTTPRVLINVAVTPEGSQEIVVLSARYGKRISVFRMTQIRRNDSAVYKFCAIRNGVDIALFTQMPRE